MYKFTAKYSSLMYLYEFIPVFLYSVSVIIPCFSWVQRQIEMDQRRSSSVEV